METLDRFLGAKFNAYSSNNTKSTANKYLASVLDLDLQDKAFKDEFNQVKDSNVVPHTYDNHED